MLIRIVRMTFQADQVETFLATFETYKHQIRHFEGCQHLSLLRDWSAPHIFTTYSHWLSEEHLNNYRHSELFQHVWGQTKPLFAQSPVAFSLLKAQEVV
ncbi:putative quinol monooxygenase [Eisenibacter elegans]|jgi:quinol monooxygenase YgiN|uniref:putative quinol monooxygenase n=1 Tax=Eisenibacter elegans TaxID=997 RepID=UPI0003F7FBCB|nr:antibiotic biosynthesis monooxygenase family protein [Eisenibacter elegans]